MKGYESGKFKPGDKLPTGETFIGETENGSPLWAEPVTAPARRPEDQQYQQCMDALDVLADVVEDWNRDERVRVDILRADSEVALATVREALERQRELNASLVRRLTASQVEIGRLDQGFTYTRDPDFERAESAEAEVRRLTEEAQRGQEPLAHLILDATTIRQAHKIARAALLSASPSDGDGA